MYSSLELRSSPKRSFSFKANLKSPCFFKNLPMLNIDLMKEFITRVNTIVRNFDNWENRKRGITIFPANQIDNRTG